MVSVSACVDLVILIGIALVGIAALAGILTKPSLPTVFANLPLLIFLAICPCRMPLFNPCLFYPYPLLALHC